MSTLVPNDFDMPESAAGRLLWGARLVEPVDMKFKGGKSLLTVELPPDVVIRTGVRYALLDELDAKDALLCDAMTEPAPEVVVLAAEDWTCPRRPLRPFGLDYEAAVGKGVRFIVYHHRPSAERPDPAYWWGIEKRMSADGRWWDTYLPHMVMDDFGDLVEVPEC